MATLLEAIVTFVGVMFVLALAAQSVQELIKAAFVVKGRTMLAAVDGLVREAVRNQGQWSIDANAILQELTRRLEALGQRGFRKGKIRLDALPAKLLKELIAEMKPNSIPGLKVEEGQAIQVMQKIADQVEKWYPLAMEPVSERYRRRMRVLAVAASALVVIPLNAGADRVYRAALVDKDLRTTVAAVVDSLAVLDDTAAGSVDTTAAGKSANASASDTTTDTTSADTAGATPATTVGTGSDTSAAAVAFDPKARAALEIILTGRLSFGPPTSKDLGKAGWWLGIVVSVIFVSLGAPFWHDLLESVFGLKLRSRLEAGKSGSGASSGGGGVA